jgi:hypothetical protein
MSHTKVKTQYKEQGAYASTETRTLYCHHNHSCDTTTFYDEHGRVASMHFGEWVSGNDIWDAMNRLWFPFKDEWHGELLDGVSYWTTDDDLNP